jgi:hypothetical protein
MSKAAQSTRVGKFVSDFAKQHPDLALNDLTLKEATHAFVNAARSFVKDSMGLSDMPMIIRTMKKEKDGKILVHFNGSELNLANLDLQQKISIDVFAVMDSTQAKKLIQSGKVKYMITEYKDAINIDGVTGSISSDMIDVPETTIMKDLLSNNSYEFFFGSYILKAHSVSRYEEKP